MTTETTTAPRANGVDLQALLDAREALTATPEAGQFTWRVSSAWVDGTHSRSTMGGFYGLGEEQTRNRTHTIEADHPEHFAATDAGATPVEIVLTGLASCLAAGVATVAENRGIQLRKVAAILEGDMDLAGIMGIDADVRNGFSGIRVRFDIEADATRDEIAALVAQSQKRSAVFDIITNPTAVHVSVSSDAPEGEKRDA
ncbi:MAG: OsmC family protein [Pseudomonadota bacterium]